MSKAPAAPQPIQVEFNDTETTTSSLVDVDSPHINTVPSNYESQSVKTNTQAERLQREEGEKHRERQYKERSKAAAQRGKAKAKGTYAKLCENKSNPVLVTNAILLTVASAGLGYGAYQKYLRGILTWETVALWSGGIGAAGLVDYFVSKWFFQNKYPPK
ncbi:predicted protein [Uncinocarpus reesii 1704]|uniref:Uncharacterized protein n=1 Tax=Uncinocarpus reesii (strain UAMH 1704) TaxID=336963 RepID=C4JX89_UNCRE|nr:uncharacterized protein UREG_06262 [Uncinocarpus reesii 1704]EEP81397.1 predicted protein [Uncinocarpus reesii 1704]